MLPVRQCIKLEARIQVSPGNTDCSFTTRGPVKSLKRWQKRQYLGCRPHLLSPIFWSLWNLP